MVGEASAHVQGESLKAGAALLVRLLNSPITKGNSRWVTIRSRKMSLIVLSIRAPLVFVGAVAVSVESSSSSSGSNEIGGSRETIGRSMQRPARVAQASSRSRSPSPNASAFDENVGASAKVFSYFVHRGSGAKVRLTQHNGATIANFPTLPEEPLKHMYVATADSDKCIFLLVWKLGRDKSEPLITEILNFRKLSREYTYAPDEYGGYELVFQGAYGVHVLRDFPHKGQKGVTNILRFEPANEGAVRQIVTSIEFIQQTCRPMERTPY
jgi:hypothetical protein